MRPRCAPRTELSRESWDFGDGSAAEAGVWVRHSYSSAGTYTVTLTVDDGCDTHVDTLAVTIS